MINLQCLQVMTYILHLRHIILEKIQNIDDDSLFFIILCNTFKTSKSVNINVQSLKLLIR